MVVLVLDDSQMRLDHYRYTYEAQGHKVICARTADECIGHLIGTRIDLLHLDHDLAEEHYLTYSEGLHEVPNEEFEAPPYSPGTGMDVVDWLCDPDHSLFRPQRCIVHSWNGSRSPVMAMALNKVGIRTLRIPFRSI